ncbi:MAG TPA: ABC transporter substrate-binding protein [Acidobacteriota bacterium]|jgi:peptide/nickel transport system substrate-binding protein
MPFKRRTLLLALAASILAGCGKPATSLEKSPDKYPVSPDALKVPAQGKFGGRIVLPLLRPPRTFNPLAAIDIDTREVTGLLHAGLLEFDHASLKITPGLAAAWKVEDSGKTYLLQLRKGVYFSDERPFGADDVIATLDAIYADNSNNALRDDWILHDRKIKYRKISQDSVELAFPFVYAPALYLISTLPILPKHLLELRGGAPVESIMTLESSPEQCAGLGPYRLKDFKNKETVVLEPNPHYWKVDLSGRRLPYLSELLLPVVSSKDSAFIQFRSGSVDMVDRLRVQDYSALVGKPVKDLEVRNAGASTKLDMLWVNQNSQFRSPKAAYFKNPNFRQALARAIDRQAIIRNVYKGYAEILSELWPTSLRDWASDRPPYPYDQKQALELFAKAGLRLVENNGARRMVDSAGNQFSLLLLTNVDPAKEAIATLLQEDFRRVGIRLQINVSDMRAVQDRFLTKRDYEMMLFSSAFPADPSQIQGVLKSRGQQHMWNPAQSSPATPWEAEIDRLTDEMLSSPDSKTYRGRFLKIQQILMEQLPVIPLVSEHVLVGFRKNVVNVKPSVLPSHLLWNAWEIYTN